MVDLKSSCLNFAAIIHKKLLSLKKILQEHWQSGALHMNKSSMDHCSRVRKRSPAPEKKTSK